MTLKSSITLEACLYSALWNAESMLVFVTNAMLA